MAPRIINADLFVRSSFELAEGPVWHQGKLWWVDILTGTMHGVDVSGTLDSRKIGGLLGAAAPCRDGSWILARDQGFDFYEWPTELLTPITCLEKEKGGNRFNDGKCDALGRFWAGSMDAAAGRPSGNLYSLGLDQQVRHHLGGIMISNGLTWSHDNKLFYHIDTMTRRVDVFDFDLETGIISRRRPFATLLTEDGYPDGMTIDEAGNLWVACWGVSCVICLEAVTGQIIARVVLPTTQPTSCTFGGTNHEKLFITTARLGVADEELAGSIFITDVGVSGKPPNCFVPFTTDRNKHSCP